MKQEIDTRLIVVETASSVSWFLMDASWMFGMPLPAKIMAVFTILTSLMIFRYTERLWSQMLVTAAMSAWASMNVCWMLHDLKSWDGGHTVAVVFFGVGALCLALALAVAKNSKDTLYSIVARFRRLRIRNGGKPDGK